MFAEPIASSQHLPGLPPQWQIGLERHKLKSHFPADAITGTHLNPPTQESPLSKQLSDIVFRKKKSPLADFLDKQNSAAQVHIKALQELDRRIADLRRISVEDGLFISADSEADLRSFFVRNALRKRPYVALLDNGNLRALWRGEGEQIGLQFLGKQMVQYVLFARRSNGDRWARSYGSDTVIDVVRQIRALNLRGLLFE